MKVALYASALSFCILGFLVAGSARGEPVLFLFVDNSAGGGTEFDGAFAGATMTRDDGDEANAITITSLEVCAPDYDAESFWNGETFIPSRTNAPGSLRMSINSNSSNAPPWGTLNNEANGWDPQEYWTFEFDVDVAFDAIQFESFGNSESAIITIDDETFALTGADQADDLFSDPFSGLIIPAGTDVRITGGGDANTDEGTSHWRLVSFTVSTPTSLPGDLNGDTLVDRADLAIFAQRFGVTGAELGDGDLNGDTIVTLADLALLQRILAPPTVEQSASPAAVPEPSTAALALLAAWGVAGASRRRR